MAERAVIKSAINTIDKTTPFLLISPLLEPVSYTHLDVYKRQPLAMLAIIAVNMAASALTKTIWLKFYRQ